MHYLVFRRPSSPSSVSPNNIIFIVGGYVHFAPFLFHFSSQQQYSSLKCLVWSVEYHWCTSGVCIHWGITQYINYRTLHCSLCDGIKTLTFHCRTPLFSEGMYVSLFRVFFFMCVWCKLRSKPGELVRVHLLSNCAAGRTYFFASRPAVQFDRRWCKLFESPYLLRTRYSPIRTSTWNWRTALFLSVTFMI